MACHFAESSCHHVVPIRIRGSEHNTVEGVEELSPELKRADFSKLRVLNDRNVLVVGREPSDVRQCRRSITDGKGTGVAKGICVQIRIGCRIELASVERFLVNSCHDVRPGRTVEQRLLTTTGDGQNRPSLVASH